jgi:type III pantothenate kinase
MLLAIDAGNTNVTCGLYNKRELVARFRLGTHHRSTSDEWGVVIRALLADQGFGQSPLRDAIIASVVPPLTPVIEQSLKDYFKVSPLIVGPGIKTGLSIRYENPQEVGADRIVNSVAAIAKYGKPLIIVDFGTATTFDAISAKGEYLGGAIAPGISISAEALFTRTSKLPRVEIKRPEKVIGRTTVEAIQSGLFYGYAGLTDRMITQMAAALKPARPRVIATGGLAGIIAAESELIDAVDPDLTLRGLQIIWEKNR